MSEEQRPRLRDLFRPRPISPDRTVTTEADEAVPFGLRVAAAYAWRALLIAAVVAGFIWIVIQLKLLVIPLMVGILIAALLWPAFEWMLRRRFPRWLAVAISVVGTLAIVSVLLWLVIWQVRAQLPEVQARTAGAVEQFRQFLLDGPLNLSEDQIQGYLDQGFELINEQAQLLWNGALAVGSTAAHVVTGAVLALFILICLLADGAGIWRWTLRLFPRAARPAADGAARNGWATLTNYARTQLLVAAIDAIGIGVGAALLGVPLAIPVAVLVFLGSFVPIVGAVVTGAFAVLLALVYNGPLIALAMLAVVLGVQQLEGHILQPILMGSAVKVHPLAVVLVVAGGSMVGGIPGALFAVPLAAFINVAAVTVSTGSWRTGDQPDADLIWSTVPRQRVRRNR
ncbi:AI-2E family transporter [Microbacterium sp. SD291]|uniref:AI-2E family transporter n=1 Tax=Microbacterium sp. SD291 TaxID=2782007 RepID=UPI001A9790A5|nr:AI-2E family transporter [Microbacterium sp. SD291]MBO0979249.1 AI-2E family transporter [Microbacterium sp. SD291]